MSRPPASPDVLLRRAARGDREAFSQFYDATISPAHTLAVCLLGEARLAEAALREAYVVAWRTASRYDPDEQGALTWLLTLVREQALVPPGAPRHDIPPTRRTRRPPAHALRRPHGRRRSRGTAPLSLR